MKAVTQALNQTLQAMAGSQVGFMLVLVLKPWARRRRA